jgi:single-strand DNA-binding protein
LELPFLISHLPAALYGASGEKCSKNSVRRKPLNYNVATTVPPPFGTNRLSGSSYRPLTFWPSFLPLTPNKKSFGRRMKKKKKFKKLFNNKNQNVMEIIGRVTKNATVKTIPSGKQVVEFDIAINEGYKPKNGGDYVNQTTFIRCTYWINANAAANLKKGAMMQLTGRLGIEAYLNRDNQAAGVITFNVTRYKTLVFAKKQEGESVVEAAQQHHAAFTPNQNAADDLPF